MSRASRSGARLRLGLPLLLPVVTLALTGLAGPAAADKGGVPNGAAADASPPADPGPPADHRPPLPATAKVPDSAPGRGRPGSDGVRPAPGPQGHRAPDSPVTGAPSTDEPGPGDVPFAPGGATGADRQHRVVVCKYVRRPGLAEVYSHPIIVDFHALLGQGFAGVFPYAFSDGQLGSVAIRWAERGERARDVADSECPTSGVPTSELPPDAGVLPAAHGQVAGVEEVQLTPVREAQTSMARETGLPQTGAPAGLVLLTVAGGLLVGGGGALAAGAVRRRVAS